MSMSSIYDFHASGIAGSPVSLADYRGKVMLIVNTASACDVNGQQAHPLFQWLKQQAPGLLGSEGIKWNFTKFLIGRDGQVIKRYASLDKPAALAADIEKALHSG